jgi:indolepyruvate ferredoxin oxidoreductase alpha subunit
MCAGCPHRSVFYVLHKLKAIVTGDIGCYTLGAMPPFEAMDACLCMGASIGASLGMEKARGSDFARRVVAVIGDSTFVHSGITGLIDHIYNKSTGTVIILDNRTTAMTGHQDHPATGLTLGKQEAAKIDLAALVRVLGVEHVRTVDPYDLRSLEQAVREEMGREEVSVIIASRACALISRERSLKEMTHQDRCTGCKKCLRLGCPALYLAGDRVRRDEDLCRGCSVCEQVCPQGKGAAEDDE